MSLNDITLRDTNYPPLTNKGAALTYGEMDDNFIEVYAYLVEMNQGGGVPAFSMATPYTGTVWVSYGGKIYRHIGAGTSTGQIPTSYPAVWQEVTIGELAHVQGTDQYLDKDGANEVTAAQVYDVVNNATITVTLASFNTLAGGNDLKVGRTYAISNALTWGTLLVHAISDSQVAEQAQVLARVPDPAQLHPSLVWSLNETYAPADLVAWDSLVYENQTGSNGSTSPFFDAVNWQPIDRADPQYITAPVELAVAYTGGTFTVLSASQPQVGSTLGGLDITGAAEPQLFVLDDGAYFNNLVDAASEGGDLMRVHGASRRNNLRMSTVQLTKGLKGTFEGNVLTNADIIVQAGGEGDIIDNEVRGATLVWASPLVSGDELDSCTFDFPVGTTLNMRSAVGTLTGAHVSKAGSTLVDSIDITSTNIIDRAANGAPDAFGVVVLTSGNATETIDRITNDSRHMPVLFTPDPALDVTFNVVSGGAVASNGEIVYSAGFTIYGNRYDTVLLEPVTINGFDVYIVKQINLT